MLAPHSDVYEPSSNNHALNTSTQTPMDKYFKTLFLASGRTRCFHFPGRNRFGELLLCPLTAQLAVFHAVTLSDSNTTYILHGIIFPPSVLDQDSISQDFKYLRQM